MERNLNFQKIYALNEYLKKSKMANVRLLPHLGPLCMSMEFLIFGTLLGQVWTKLAQCLSYHYSYQFS